jgi:hypothetical protein
MIMRLFLNWFCLFPTLKKEVCDVFLKNLFFLRKYEKKKANNMVSLDLTLLQNQVFLKWSELIE